MIRVRAVIATAFVAASAGAVGLPPMASAAPPSRLDSVHHVVLMTQGGRSFDNLLGARSGVDGIPAHGCQIRSTVAQPACVRPQAIRASTPRIPLRTTALTQRRSVDRGGMNGFVVAQKTRSSDGTSAMGYYRPSSVPLLGDIASRGVVFDHWFSGVPGGTVANRLFGITAIPPGDPQEIPVHGWADDQVIFDRLSAAGVPWRIYVQNYEPALTIATAATKQRLGGQVVRVPILAMHRYTSNKALMSHVVDLKQYYKDLAANRLPAVSYIVSTSSTEQAPRSPTKGQQLTRAVLNALLASKAWSSSAFLLQYDSSGGWYDHVQPPRLDGATVGLRVPAILVSPFADAGTVDHDTFDAASALKLVEATFGLPPLADRDRDAANPAKALTVAGPPRQASLVGIPNDRNVAQPVRSTLYLGYGAALLAAVAIAASVYLLARRDARPQGGPA